MGAPILIIEDTEAHRMLLRDILALTGKEIIEATNREEGIRLVKEIKPELANPLDVEVILSLVKQLLARY